MNFKFISSRESVRVLCAELGLALIFTSCFFLPLAARLLLRLPQLVFTNFTDSVFYLSYSQSFQELFLRHGFIYYASRFGAVFPDAFAFNLLGPTDGPIVLRLFLACLVSGALFFVGRLYFSPLIGLLASLLWSFQPVAARLWCTTYLDSIAVPFLILGLCLVLLFRSSSAAAFFAGILLAFSVTSHLYLVILAGCLVPLVVGARWGDRRLLLCTQLPWLLGGFLLTIAASYYWYSKNCGIGAFWQPTLELMRKMSDGQTEIWGKPFAAALSETPLWITPFPFLAWALAYWKNLDSFGRGAFGALLLSTVFFWAGDLIGGAYALSMPFYFSFLLPVFLFSVIAFAGNAARHTKLHQEYLIFVLCVVAAVAGPMILKAQSKWPLTVTFSLCAVAVLGCGFYFYRRAFEQIAFILCVLFLSCLTLATGFFSQFLADVRIRNSKDHKIPALAVKLKQMLPPASEGDVIKFWYPESEDYELKMLQSFFLHTSSMLPGDVGLAQYPQLSQEDAEAVRRAGVQQMVLLDKDASRIDMALQTVAEAGMAFSVIQSETLSLGRDKIFFKRVALKHSNLSNATKIDLSAINCFPEASIAQNEEKCFLTTSDQRNLERNFDFWCSLSNLAPSANGVSISAKVLRGCADVFLIDDTDKVVASVEIWPTEKPISRTLYAGKDVKAHTLMIRNKMPDTSKSILEISGIEIGDIALDGN
jgi:hypothetical protein